MLNFRNTNIFFAVLVLAILSWGFFYHVPLFVYILILFFYSLILFYGSYLIQAGFYLKSICALPSDKKQVAFSFDDGPSQNYTIEILDLLKAHDIKAAFFCIGNRIPNNEPILKRIHEDGHIIGNHSYSHHFWFDLFSSKKMFMDMLQMDEMVEKAIGVRPRFFRPPYGVTNPNLRKAIVDAKYISVGWNIRSMDTVIKEPNRLLEKIKKSIKPGAIILFHDTSKTTVEVLPELIRWIRKNGYEIVGFDNIVESAPYK